MHTSAASLVHASCPQLHMPWFYHDFERVCVEGRVWIVISACEALPVLILNSLADIPCQVELARTTVAYVKKRNSNMGWHLSLKCQLCTHGRCYPPVGTLMLRLVQWIGHIFLQNTAHLCGFPILAKNPVWELVKSKWTRKLIWEINLKTWVLVQASWQPAATKIRGRYNRPWCPCRVALSWWDLFVG